MMKCDRLDGPVKTELAPYVICVVVDLARESCTASYEPPVNEDVWKQCCDWGIVAQKGTPTHCPDWSHYQWAFDFHMQNLRLKTNMFLPWSTVSIAVFMCGMAADSERKREGKVLALMNFECVEGDLLEHLKDL